MRPTVRWQDCFSAESPSSFKDLLVYELRVAQGLFHEATDGLTQDEASWQPHEDMEPVCWIIEHVTFSLDLFQNKAITGSFTVDHRPEQNRWNESGWNPIWPTPSDTYLPLPQLLDRMDRVFERACEEVIKGLDEQSLWDVPPAGEHGEHPLEALCHAHRLAIQHDHMHHHLRQIYLLLGRLGKGVEKWPYA